MKGMKLFFQVMAFAFFCHPSMASNLERWYSSKQIEKGETLYQQNCADCHGPNAEATPNWRQSDSYGFYPPPPLNGSAHTWHHDLESLRRTIRNGGITIGGQMPPFETLLDTEQIDSVIAFFQSKWDDEIYQRWDRRFKISETQRPLEDIAKLINNKPELGYLKKHLGNIRMNRPTPSALEKLYEIRFDKKVLYLSEDGQYAIIGELIDLKNGKNLARQNIRK